MNRPKYYNKQYNHLLRWCSYWYQIHSVLELKPQTVLEIGAGNKLVSGYLAEQGLDIKTVDIDAGVEPDIVASILDIPVSGDSVDVVLASQILEHIPFTDVPKALGEMYRVSRKYVVISVPDAGRTFSFRLKIPGFPKIQYVWNMPTRRSHVMKEESGHYWELGTKEYSTKKLKKEVAGAGFSIINMFTLFEHPYHRFFILEKKAYAK